MYLRSSAAVHKPWAVPKKKSVNGLTYMASLLFLNITVFSEECFWTLYTILYMNLNRIQSKLLKHSLTKRRYVSTIKWKY
jgi:hypothetical protein